MRKWALFSVFILGSVHRTQAAEPRPSPWLTDWPAAQKIARHENKPIFAVLH